MAWAFSFAGDVDKAFKYLNTGDYPNAKKYLLEALADEPDNAAVNYGLAKYFSSKEALIEECLYKRNLEIQYSILEKMMIFPSIPM